MFYRFTWLFFCDRSSGPDYTFDQSPSKSFKPVKILWHLVRNRCPSSKRGSTFSGKFESSDCGDDPIPPRKCSTRICAIYNTHLHWSYTIYIYTRMSWLKEITSILHDGLYMTKRAEPTYLKGSGRTSRCMGGCRASRQSCKVEWKVLKTKVRY